MHGDRQREAILEALAAAPGGLDTHALAAAVDLHPNTIRWHLGVLADAGLVAQRPSAATSAAARASSTSSRRTASRVTATTIACSPPC